MPNNYADYDNYDLNNIYWKSKRKKLNYEFINNLEKN